MNDFNAMNEVYSEGKNLLYTIKPITNVFIIIVFTDRHPARSTVQVAGLPRVS
jgi:hypothetical protein